MRSPSHCHRWSPMRPSTTPTASPPSPIRPQTPPASSPTFRCRASSPVAAVWELPDMQTWAIANQKGGVGKTTTSLCLARGLAADGARVVLIDLDPHASLTRAFAVPTDPAPAGRHDLFNPGGAELRSLARGTPIDNLLLVAAQPALATLERRGATQPGLGLSIGRALHAARANFDYAVLDCPPTLGLLMVNALAAADRLVVPTQTDPLALHGLADMLRTADMVER